MQNGVAVIDEDEDGANNNGIFEAPLDHRTGKSQSKPITHNGWLMVAERARNCKAAGPYEGAVRPKVVVGMAKVV